MHPNAVNNKMYPNCVHAHRTYKRNIVYCFRFEKPEYMVMDKKILIPRFCAIECHKDGLCKGNYYEKQANTY